MSVSNSSGASVAASALRARALTTEPRDAGSGSPQGTRWMSDRIARLALIGIFIALVGIVLHLTQALLVPIFAALIVGGTIGPLADRLERYNVPPFITIVTLLTMLVTGLYWLIIGLSAPAADWIGRVDEIFALLTQRLAFLTGPIEQLQKAGATIRALGSAGNPTVAVDVAGSDLLQSAAAVLTPALGQSVLFGGTLLFFLAQRPRLKRKLATLFQSRPERLLVLKIVSDVESDLATYVGTVTAINFGLGVATALVMGLIGLPNAIIWGLLAFVLNFLPYIGPAVLVVLLFIAGLLTFDTVGYALLPALAMIALGTVEGQYLTPSIIGRRLTLNPFLVFVALAFWTWLWGASGAFLAVPILIIISVVAARSTQRTLPLP